MGVLAPATPVLDRLVEKTLAGRDQLVLERLAVGQHQVIGLVDRKDPALVQPAQREIAGQAQLLGRAGVADVVRAEDFVADHPPVIPARRQLHPGTGCARQRADDADQHVGLVIAVIEQEARCEIDQLEAARAIGEDRAQHVGVVQVGLLTRPTVGRRDAETAALLLVQQGSEHKARIEPGPAEPDHISAPIDQRAVLTIPDDPQVHGSLTHSDGWYCPVILTESEGTCRRDPWSREFPLGADPEDIRAALV